MKEESIEWFDISDELLKGYQISKCGKVRNSKTGFIIKQHLNINGYWTVGIRGKIKRFLAIKELLILITMK